MRKIWYHIQKSKQNYVKFWCAICLILAELSFLCSPKVWHSAFCYLVKDSKIEPPKTIRCNWMILGIVLSWVPILLTTDPSKSSHHKKLLMAQQNPINYNLMNACRLSFYCHIGWFGGCQRVQFNFFQDFWQLLVPTFHWFIVFMVIILWSINWISSHHPT